MKKPTSLFLIPSYGWILGILASVCLLLFGHAVAEPPLGRLVDLRVMPREVLVSHPQVRVRGVVTWRWKSSPWGDFCLQDESAGIWVDMDWANDLGVWKDDPALLDQLSPGLEVEIEGVLHPGGFAPVLLPRSLKLLGERELPKPQDVPLAKLMNGADGQQRVEMSGVVQSCLPYGNAWRLRVDTGLGYFLVRLPKVKGVDPTMLEDAQVRFLGVATSVFNAKGEFTQVRMLVNGPEDLVIEKSAPADPFSVPRVPLAELAGFSPEGRSLHRRRIEGTVSYFVPGVFLYLQERDAAVRVNSTTHEPLRVGDRVEASGFIEMTGPVAGLSGAIIRKVGSGSLPEAIPTTVEEIKSAFTPGKSSRPVSPRGYDGLLVSVTGRLLRVQRNAENGGPRLIMDSGGSITTAELNGLLRAERAAQLETLRSGSMIRVTGVASLQHELPEPAAEFVQPTRLDVLLRDGGDVVVLQEPSWWTSQRLEFALAGTVLILTASLIWTFVLRRLVRRRTERLEDLMRTHRDWELEFQAAQHERQRLAADMHDGVQQLIAGAAFRLEAAAVHLEEIPAAVQVELSAARSALLRAQTSLRNSLSGLVLVEEGSGDFAALIAHAAATMEHWPREAVVVSVQGQPYSLSRHVMGSLLLLMQEAAGNAFKHGKASRVRVMLSYDAEVFEMRVEDNGRGFDPAAAPDTRHGHFGLESMRHRMKWLRGSVEIISQSGQGASVRIRLPKGRAQAADSSDHDVHPALTI